MLPLAVSVDGWKLSDQIVEALLKERTKVYVEGGDMPPELEASWRAVIDWRHGVMSLVTEEIKGS